MAPPLIVKWLRWFLLSLWLSLIISVVKKIIIPGAFMAIKIWLCIGGTLPDTERVLNNVGCNY